MPKVNLVAHGIQVELDASEVSIRELRHQAMETLKEAIEAGKTKPIGFVTEPMRPPPDKSWIETE